jgi:hypothetical protein
VCTWVNVVFNFIFGSIIAFSLVRLTTQLGGGIIAFVERLFW